MTTITQNLREFGLSANKKFNDSFGWFSEEACKVTCSDKIEPFLGNIRTTDGFLKSVSDLPAILPELLHIVPKNFAKFVPVLSYALPEKVKTFSKIVAETKTTLTALEILSRVKKWRNTNIEKTSWARIANQVFNLWQKVVESIFLTPAKWGFIDLGRFCVRLGSFTGRAITPLHFALAKDFFMIASSSCAVYATTKELAKFNSDLGRAKVANDTKEVERLQKELQKTYIARRFDFFKASLGTGTVIITGIANGAAFAAMGPAGIAALKVATYVAGCAVCFTGFERTVNTNWQVSVTGWIKNPFSAAK